MTHNGHLPRDFGATQHGQRAVNLGSNEPVELAYRIEDPRPAANGIAADKCSGDVRTMGREQFMPLSREQ